MLQNKQTMYVTLLHDLKEDPKKIPSRALSAPFYSYLANITSAKLSHATSLSLPAYPWGPDASPSPLSEETVAPIDLTSSMRSSPIYEEGLLPDTKRPRLEQRPNDGRRRSAKENTHRYSVIRSVSWERAGADT